MMGASLEDTLSAFRSKKIQGIPGGNYPAIDERIAAAKKGWEIVYNLNKALASKKLNDIVNYATEIIKFHPYNGYYYHYRSQAKYELGYYAGTLEDCQTAIKFNKTIIWAYNICGAAKSKQGDYKQAIAFYNEAIEKDENNSEIAQIYTNRGEARYKLGDRTGAISDYKKAARWGNPFAQNVLRSLGEGW
jgi:tetratricopeptide (TPR) repeat protein